MHSDPDTPRHHGRRHRWASGMPAVAALLSTLGLTLAGCAANPDDAPVVDNDSASSATPFRDGAASGDPAALDPQLRTLNIGVDEFSGNLNPHVVGNNDAVVDAIAALTLPSAFRPADNLDGWEMDTSLLKRVVPDDATNPTTVRYELNPAAQWSDGTPISIGDFTYLASAMTSEPAARDAALYDRIASIEADGPQGIVVTFTEPFAPWRALFSNLLPSHIYRTEARSFATMMDESQAASAGAYSVKKVDAGRGIVELHRNDRYWSEGAALTDVLTFTVVPSAHIGAQLLRTNQTQLYATRPAATTGLTLDAPQHVRTRTVTRDVQLNLLLNSTNGRMGNPDVRTSILSLIDATMVGAIVSGDPKPTRPEWPAVPRPDTLARLDSPLTIAAPSGSATAIIGARSVADQLDRAGIPATVVTRELTDLVNSERIDPDIDAVVLWQSGLDTPADFLTQFHCAPVRTVGDSGSGGRGDGGSGGRSASASRSAEASASRSAAASASTTATDAWQSDTRMRVHGANVSGLCDRTLDGLIDKALQAGPASESNADHVAELRAHVAEQHVLLPLLTDTTIVAANAAVKSTSGPMRSWPAGPYAGLFVDAPRWTRIPMTVDGEAKDPESTPPSLSTTDTTSAGAEQEDLGSGEATGAPATPGRKD